MAFIRQKGKAFYLVESRREGGKVRQHIICYLGRHSTLEAALAHWQEKVHIFQAQAERYRSYPILRVEAEAKAYQAQAKVGRLQALLGAYVGSDGHYMPAAVVTGEHQSQSPVSA